MRPKRLNGGIIPLINIVDFVDSHIEKAMDIALERYNLERNRVPALPKIDAIPDLTPFAEFGLGVAPFSPRLWFEVSGRNTSDGRIVIIPGFRF